jgi:hypothetical protein
MPQYRGTPGPKNGNGWVGEWGGGCVGGFWDSIGNVIEENNIIKKIIKKKPKNSGFKRKLSVSLLQK